MIHLRMQACRHFSSQLWDYTTGELDAANRARLEAHLAGCASCRHQLDLEQRLTSAFAAARSRPVPASVGNFAHILPSLRPAASRTGRPAVMLTGAGGLCGALAIALIFALRPPAPVAPPLQRPEGPTEALVTPPTNDTSHGRPAPGERHALVVAENTHHPHRPVTHTPVRIAMLPVHRRLPVLNAAFHPRAIVRPPAPKARRSSTPADSNGQMELASLDGAGQREPRSQFEYVMAPVSLSSEQEPQRSYVIGGYGGQNPAPTTASWQPDTGDSTAW